MKEKYSGNNPKLTMIHDREGIHNLQQQLHRADQAYKSSPAHQNQESSGSAVYMTTPQSYRSSMSQHWRASNPSFDDPIAHDEAGRAGEGSPTMNYDTSKGSHSHPHDSPTMMVSPLNRTVEELQQAKTDMQKNRDDKKMGVKRYNKKVGRLNKKITRKGGEVPGNSPTEMHEGVKHDPDTKKESKTTGASASPSKTKKSKLEKDNEKEMTRLNEKVNSRKREESNEKENTRLKEKVNSRREKESSKNASDAMNARLKAKRDKDRENKSKEQSQKEMKALSDRKSSERGNRPPRKPNAMSEAEKIEQAKQMS